MLLALENAIAELLKTAFPALFVGAGAATLSFPADSWGFDPLAADPVAGEPGLEDAVDTLPFDPDAPTGPYRLTRPPYPGPRRVYLSSAAGELVALGNAEALWNPADPASFSIVARAGRVLAGFDHLEVHYGVIAAATRVKTLHQFRLEIAAADPAAAERALALTLAALILNRDALMQAGGCAWNLGGYQAQGTVKTLKFSAGGAPAGAVRTLTLESEVDLRLERLLAEDEGTPIQFIASPGKTPGAKPIVIDPAVQA